MKSELRLTKPSDDELAELRERARFLEPTSPAGLLGCETPTGFHRGVWECELPYNDFDRACDAIRSWSSQRAAGIRVFPDRPAIVVGETVALAIRVFPVWITASCRIIEVFDEPDTFGFTYATLPHHPEDGEESFVVHRREDATITYTVTAVARPASIESKVFPPATRFMQNRAITAYLRGVSSYLSTG